MEKEKIPFSERYNRALRMVERAIEKMAQGIAIPDSQAVREKMRETSFVSQLIFSFAVAGSEAVRPQARKLALFLFGKDVQPVIHLAEKLDVSWKSFSKKYWGWKKGQFLGDLGYNLRTQLTRSEVEEALDQMGDSGSLTFDDLAAGEVDWRDFLKRNIPPEEPSKEKEKVKLGDFEDFFSEDVSSGEKPEPSTDSSSLAKKAGLDDEDLF